MALVGPSCSSNKPAPPDSAQVLPEAGIDSGTHDAPAVDTAATDVGTPDMSTPDQSSADLSHPDTLASDTVPGPTFSATATLFSLTQKATGGAAAPVDITLLFPHVSSRQDGPIPATDNPFFAADATYRGSGGGAGCVGQFFTGVQVDAAAPVLPTPDVDVGDVLLTGWQGGNQTTTSVHCSFAAGTYACAPVCPGVDAGGCATSALGPFGAPSNPVASWFSGASTETIQAEFLGKAGFLGPIGDMIQTPSPTPMAWGNEESQTTKSLGFVATAMGGGQLDTVTIPSSGNLTLAYTCPGCTVADVALAVVSIVVTADGPAAGNPYPTLAPDATKPFANVQCIEPIIGAPASGTLVVPANVLALLNEVGTPGQVMTLVAAGNGNANLSQVASPGSATWATGVGSVGWNPTP
jgi:hypothetical protein